MLSRPARAALLGATLLPGCVFITAEDQRARVDDDNDGFSVLDDCDDRRATVHPGAPERCDGLDNDCDGERDEGLAPDADGDGVGGVAAGACQVGWVATTGDCDDTDPAVFPGQTERCNGRNDGCRPGWQPADELGVVTWTPDGGAPVDRSADFPTDSRDAPVRVELAAAGRLDICRGAAPYRVRIVQGDVAALHIIGRAVPLDSGDTGVPPDSADSGDNGDTGDTGDTDRLAAADTWPVLNGAASTTAGPTVQLSGTGGRAVLSGLVLTGGVTTATVPGGGLHLSGLASAELSALVITGNHASAGSVGGAGLYAGSVGQLELADSRIAHNTGGDDTAGGGALVEFSGLRMVSVDFESNRAATGGGLAFYGSGFRLDARAVSLHDNWGNRYGGGLYLGPGTDSFVTGLGATANRADAGGAVYTEGNLSCFGQETGLVSAWDDNWADTGGATAAIAGSGALSFAGCQAAGAAVAATSPIAACSAAPDLALFARRGDTTAAAATITGTAFYCSVTTCHGEVAVAP